MAKSHRRHRKPRWIRRQTEPGASPGTLAVDPEAIPPSITALSYGPAEAEEVPVSDPSALAALRGKRPVLWVHCHGLGDASVLQRLGEVFGLHRLALEDVVNTHQRPKVEQYGDHLFVVVRVPRAELGAVDTEQVSLFMGPDYVLSFEERPPEVFAAVRERIRNSRGRIRQEGTDYLCYALLDSAVDSYFPVLEAVGDRLEELEDLVLISPGKEVVTAIHQAKHEMLTLRRAVWPQREALGNLYREPSELIRADTRVYLRDCYDHTIQILDLLETYREITSGLMDVYLSSVSHRTNQVMKVLTIIATIFMPLSFLAGLYGMNFQTDVSPFNMPELTWRYGYPFALGLMASTAGGFLFFFWRKGWLREPKDRRRRGGQEEGGAG